MSMSKGSPGGRRELGGALQGLRGLRATKAEDPLPTSPIPPSGPLSLLLGFRVALTHPKAAGVCRLTLVPSLWQCSLASSLTALQGIYTA